MERKQYYLSMRFIVLTKGQQDYLLPFVEDGTITLIGATTENPYFEVNGALLSRSSVFELHALKRRYQITTSSRRV